MMRVENEGSLVHVAETQVATCLSRDSGTCSMSFPIRRRYGQLPSTSKFIAAYDQDLQKIRTRMHDVPPLSPSLFWPQGIPRSRVVYVLRPLCDRNLIHPSPSSYTPDPLKGFCQGWGISPPLSESNHGGLEIAPE